MWVVYVCIIICSLCKCNYFLKYVYVYLSKWYMSQIKMKMSLLPFLKSSLQLTRNNFAFLFEIISAGIRKKY